MALMTLGQTGMRHPSLSGMVNAIKGPLSREALHNRFTDTAVAFMKRAVDVVLKQKLSFMPSLESELLQHFVSIRIFDSTGWDVNAALRKVLPGYGGDASEANCKVQACYEYLHGELSFFDVQPGIVPDNSYTEKLPGHIKRGELLLIDLGYFALKTFYDIAEAGAFFLSRLLIRTKLFTPETQQRIDLLSVLHKVPGNIHEMQVLLGGQEDAQVSCRLICLRVSEEVANARRRKLIKNAQKKGRIPSELCLKLADWTLMVTNVPVEWLPANMARHLYCLRWQIELVFKQLKSVLCIHICKTGKINRLLCEVYGKMLMAIIVHRIHTDRNIMLWNNERREVSMDKLYKRIQERAFIILELLLKSPDSAIQYLESELESLLKNCLKNKQRSRRTTLEILEFGPLGGAM